MSENSTGILRSNLDLNHPQKLGEDELDQLSNVRQMQDEQIDFSDLPPSAQETVWSRPGNFREVIANRVEASKEQRPEPRAKHTDGRGAELNQL